MRATTVSPRSTAEFALGGIAGRSIRSTLVATIVSTVAVITSSTVPRRTAALLVRSTGRTVPGIDAASASIAALSSSAGIQRTEASAAPLAARRPMRRVGTIAPLAASRTPSTATRPSHRTLAPTPAGAPVPPNATNHPSAADSGMETASARCPSGSGTPAWSSQPTGGPPIASRRVASSSLFSGRAPRPPAHTTTSPRNHEAWSRTSPTMSDSAGCSPYSSTCGERSTGAGGRKRAAVEWRLSSVSAKSAITWSRSSPDSERTEARSSSVSAIRRSIARSDTAWSACSRATSSSDAQPPATDHTTRSSCFRSCINPRSRSASRRRPRALVVGRRRGRRPSACVVTSGRTVFATRGRRHRRAASTPPWYRPRRGADGTILVGRSLKARSGHPHSRYRALVTYPWVGPRVRERCGHGWKSHEARAHRAVAVRRALSFAEVDGKRPNGLTRSTSTSSCLARSAKRAAGDVVSRTKVRPGTRPASHPLHRASRPVVAPAGPVGRPTDPAGQPDIENVSDQMAC